MKKLLALLAALLLALPSAPSVAQPFFRDPQVFRYIGVAASLPATCQVAQLAFVTNATAGTNIYECTSTNTWTQQGAAAAATSTIADDTTTNATMYPVWVTAATGNLPLKVTSTRLSFNPSTGLLTSTGLTVTNAPTFSAMTITRVPFFGTAGLFTDSASLVYDDSTKRLTVGTGSGTSSGWTLGYQGGISGVSELTRTGNTFGSTTFAMRSRLDLTEIGGSGGSGVVNVIPDGSTIKTSWIATAGAGPSITAGTATTDVSALSITQTMNAAGVTFEGIKGTFTETAVASGSKLVEIVGGTLGTTDVFSVMNASTSGPRITVGTGSGTTAGWLGGNVSTNIAGWVNTALTLTSGNAAILQGIAGNTTLNSATGQDILFTIGTGEKYRIYATAGAGPSITAGTTTTNANRALSISQTWTDGTSSNIGIVGNFDMGATGTATGKLLSLQAGVAGTTEVYSLSQAGLATHASGVEATYILADGTDGRHFSRKDSSAGYVLGASDNANLTWLAPGVIGVGTGAAGSAAGNLSLAGALFGNLADVNYYSANVIGLSNAASVAFSSTSASNGSKDVNLSRISANVLGVGTGAAGSAAGTLSTGGLLTASNVTFGAASTFLTKGGQVVYSPTAPTIASGGCTSPSIVNNNGTARFEADVGTGCSGSQPLVFTLPATTTGWNCTAQNVSNPASSVAAQSSAVSTTSVTITSYSRTLGTAQAWTDGDNVVVSCLGG